MSITNDSTPLQEKACPRDACKPSNDLVFTTATQPTCSCSHVAIPQNDKKTLHQGTPYDTSTRNYQSTLLSYSVESNLIVTTQTETTSQRERPWMAVVGISPHSFGFEWELSLAA
eukprot:6243137-Amphidinium_carterae.2